MSLTPEELYFDLGRLVAEMPDLATAEITPETSDWIARAVALVGLSGSLADKIQLSVATENLDGVLRPRKAQTITAIVHRALARAEGNVPPALQGAFITARNAFEVFAALRKLLSMAQVDVLLVDPYADAAVLTDYATLVPDGVSVRLLTGPAANITSLSAAAQNWLQRFGDARPLAIRVADADVLHDKLILVDNVTGWELGESFNNLGKRKHVSLVRISVDATDAKLAALTETWDTAAPLEQT